MASNTSLRSDDGFSLRPATWTPRTYFSPQDARNQPIGTIIHNVRGSTISPSPRVMTSGKSDRDEQPSYRDGQSSHDGLSRGGTRGGRGGQKDGRGRGRGGMRGRGGARGRGGRGRGTFDNVRPREEDYVDKVWYNKNTDENDVYIIGKPLRDHVRCKKCGTYPILCELPATENYGKMIASWCFCVNEDYEPEYIADKPQNALVCEHGYTTAFVIEEEQEESEIMIARFVPKDLFVQGLGGMSVEQAVPTLFIK